MSKKGTLEEWTLKELPTEGNLNFFLFLFWTIEILYIPFWVIFSFTLGGQITDLQTTFTLYSLLVIGAVFAFPFAVWRIIQSLYLARREIRKGK